MKHDKSYDKSVYRAFVLVSQIGISLLVPICLMTLLGWYLDRKLDTVFITVVLFIIGVVAGGQNAYKLVMQTMREDEPAGKDRNDSMEARPCTDKPKKTSGWVQSDSKAVEGAEHPDGFVD